MGRDAEAPGEATGVADWKSSKSSSRDEVGAAAVVETFSFGGKVGNPDAGAGTAAGVAAATSSSSSKSNRFTSGCLGAGGGGAAAGGAEAAEERLEAIRADGPPVLELWEDDPVAERPAPPDRRTSRSSSSPASYSSNSPADACESEKPPAARGQGDRGGLVSVR